ncbi:MAG: type 1 glutamine amidotransferase [Candidatus Aminicenantes bacterium]|nr:type 1 glutamine amidotransferase [Candidatus Aminicenantes bacterium]
MRSDVRVAIIDNAIEPEAYKPVEHWSRWLAVPWQAFRAPEGCLPARPSDFSHYILTGSEASILDREAWVESEVGFVRETFAAGASILGSCYGHQLLAFALFGPAHIGRCPSPEVGWLPIRTLVASRLLGPVGVVFAFSHHFDEVRSLPAGCTVLARSEACSVQGFGIDGRNVWGLQMHPEIDVPSARAFMRDLAARGAKSGDLDLAALETEDRDTGLITRIVSQFIHFSS